MREDRDVRLSCWYQSLLLMKCRNLNLHRHEDDLRVSLRPLKGQKEIDMRKLLWCSRHKPTTEQLNALAEIDFQVVEVNDLDAYASEADVLHAFYAHDIVGIFAVHPRIAGIAVKYKFYVITVVSVNRAASGEKPEFAFGGFQIIEP